MSCTKSCMRCLKGCMKLNFSCIGCTVAPVAQQEKLLMQPISIDYQPLTQRLHELHGKTHFFYFIFFLYFQTKEIS